MASSHLIPSGSGGFRAGFGVRTRGRMGFWTRRDRYNNWGVEELVGRSPRGLFGRRVAEIGLDPERVLSMPAVAKLLAWWRIAFERAERDGPRHFGDRFVSIRFETFCSDPIGQVGRVYRALGEPPPDLDLSRVRPPNPPHRPDDPRWATWFRELAIDPG